MIFGLIIYMLSACVILYYDIRDRSSENIFDVLATIIMAIIPVLNTIIACAILLGI